MDLFAPKHLLLILLIVLLVFGGKKIKSLGSDLGSAFRGFKKAMNEGETEEPAKQIQAQAPPAKDAEFPEVASTKAEHASENKPAPRA
ncbi:MAG: twin-arginine translocase TatA/TatE family subunit [Steroidobacterales bacterium]